MEDTKKIDEITDSISNLSYEEKRLVYIQNYSVGIVGNKFDDMLILLSLLTLTYKKLEKKNSKITPLDILLKITKQTKDDSVFYRTLEALSILTTDIAYSFDDISSCGLKTSKEIINKIKELLHTWTPF